MPSNDSVQTLYSDHHGWLHAWLRSKLGNAADAADLAHDTFVRLLQRREHLQLNTPRAFLRTVARGLVIVTGAARNCTGPTWRHWPMCRKHSISGRTREAPCWNCLSVSRACSTGLKPKVRRAFLLAQCGRG